MRIIISFALVIQSLFLYAVFSQQAGTINGRVSDLKDNKGIEADIKLFGEKDSTLVKGTKSDSTGAFKFDKLEFGTYRLEVTAIDYSPFVINKLILNAASLTLDTLHLKKQNISTDEIIVEDTKGLFTISGDKKIFNVDQSLVTKGGNALDVLKKTPLVDVDINDNVTLRGSRNVMILVDDKPNNKFANLKTLPSNAILKIELITNPPAKYSAEGVTGIINIVLKKGEGLGFNGSVYTGIGSKDKYYGGISLNLKKDKTGIFTNGYYGLYNYSFDYTERTEYFSPHSYLDVTGSGNGKSKYGYGSFGIEYDPIPKNTIGLDAFFNGSRYSSLNKNTNNSLDSNSALSSYYKSDNSYNSTWNNYTVNLYYTGKYGELGRELSAEAAYSGNENNSYMGNNITNFGGNGTQQGSTLSKRDTTFNKQYNLNTQADYTHPFTKEMKMEAGFKGSYRVNDNNFSSDTLNNSIGIFQSDEVSSNHFKLTENINALYTTFSNTLGKFGYKIGLRAEYTHTKGELLSGKDVFTQDYTDVFPTVNLTYNIGTMNMIQASYSRRITRPNIWRLNPFVYKYSPRYIQFGNPGLKPEFTNSFELSFIYYSKIITITPLAFYRRSTGIISNYSYLQDTVVTVTTFRNASGSNAYGMDLILSSRSISWLTLNGTLSFYNTRFDSEAITDYISEKGFSWKAKIRTYISIAQIFNIELYYNYSGKRVNAQGVNDPTQSLDIGFSTSVLNKKLNISMRASDIFNTQKWASATDASGYSSKYNSTYDSRVVYLNLSYSFGNTDEYYSKKKKTKQNENEGNDTQQDNNVK